MKLLVQGRRGLSVGLALDASVAAGVLICLFWPHSQTIRKQLRMSVNTKVPARLPVNSGLLQLSSMYLSELIYGYV